MQSKTKAENWLTNDTEKEELAIVGFDRKSQPWSNTIYIIHLRKKKYTSNTIEWPMLTLRCNH